MAPPVFRLVDHRRQVLLMAAGVVGVTTGLAVTAFDVVTARLALGHLLRAPLWLQTILPAVGLVVAFLCLRFLAHGADATTSDAYITSFHDNRRPLDQRPVIGRILASIATLGSGGAMGFEGPAIYIGAAIGSFAQTRVGRHIRAEDAKALLVAGAAGGLAAIFKAPATGVLYALEVPYSDDIARHGIVASLVAAAASYLTFVLFMGTRPIIHLTTAGTSFAGIDLVGAVVVGVSAGIGARLFVRSLNWAKRMSHMLSPAARIAVFGAGSAALVITSEHLFGTSLSLGPGYQVFQWIVDPRRALWLIAVLLVVRLAAFTFTVAGGGAGGKFIPLVVEGAILGRLIGGMMIASGLHSSSEPATTMSLFTVLGVAAFLGAGYRTPLAGVMFVAESTGRAVFVVPGLVAAAISQLFVADRSVSPVQLSRRGGYLESRFELPVSSALMTDVLTVPSDATVAEFIAHHVVQNRQRAATVLGTDGTYLGLCILRDAVAVPRDAWNDRLVAEVMRIDLPTARFDWTLRDALAALDGLEADRLALLDDHDVFIGEIRREEIIKLGELLDDTGS
ncbi:MAG: chloride channel protein [Actinobacteria bacterium]|nr:chloride channel protein [Actinomycetota bacterium]